MTRYYTKITDRQTDKLLYEYDYSFEDTDQVIEDVYRMIQEGFLTCQGEEGYRVEIFDVHPDVPGVVAVRVEKL